MKNFKKVLMMMLMFGVVAFSGLLSMNTFAKGKMDLEDDENPDGVVGCSIELPLPEYEVAGSEEDPEEEGSETESSDNENQEETE